MKISCNVENLYNIIVKSLRDTIGMNDEEITCTLIYVGTNGASVMEGHRNGLCIKLQTIAPFMIPIHCMAHRLNLAYRFITIHPHVA